MRHLMTNGLAPRRSRGRSPASAATTGSCCSRSASRAIPPRICAPGAPGRRCRSTSTWRRWIGCSRSPTATPRGLRDKALIELLYATGLRVTELLSLKPGDVSLDAGYLTCIGKGDKQRIVPLGHAAADWVRRYLAEGRPALLPPKGRKSPWLFVNAKGGGRLSRVGFWKVLKDYGTRPACHRA